MKIAKKKQWKQLRYILAFSQPTDALVYDGVYLIASSLDKVYQVNSAIIRNFDGECYHETPKRDWELGIQMFKMFTTVCLLLSHIVISWDVPIWLRLRIIQFDDMVNFNFKSQFFWFIVFLWCLICANFCGCKYKLA